MERWTLLLLVVVLALSACTSTGKVISESVENESDMNESIIGEDTNLTGDSSPTQNTQQSSDNQQTTQQNNTSNTTSDGGSSSGGTGSTAPCSGIVCNNSTRTCPDGFVSSCRNACIAGQCGTCDPSCEGHETVNLCENVACTNSSLICPDGFNSTCNNSCNQTTGLCSACAPTCENHCTPYSEWSCIPWSVCVNGTQFRTCADPWGNETNGCGYLRNETQNCTAVLPQHEKIIFTEVYYNYNGTPGHYSDGEWIEVYNPTDMPINLSSWRIEDNAKNWSFGDGVIIQNKSYFIIAHNADVFQSLYGCTAHISDSQIPALNNDGDQLTVFNLTSAVDFVAWESGHSNSYPEWNINATINKTIARNGTVDTDTPSDWLSNQTPTPACIA